MPEQFSNPLYTQEFPTLEETSYTEAERNAMRSYLQRSEVRLSTLHRIATAFIGGAGLLLLIPVFLKDVIDHIIVILLDNFSNQYPEMGETNGWMLTLLLMLMIGYPLILSFIVPLYGFFLLLKDIVHFYYTIYVPGFPVALMNPTFALTGVNFSPDESMRVKQDVIHYQYIEEHVHYMLPFSPQRRELYFDQILEKTKQKTRRGIIPSSREKLVSVDDVQAHEKTVTRFNTAMGLARSLDRTLAQEVAVSEMALVRHILYLRRLVLRYVKTLLMFIWTVVATLIMLPFLTYDHLPIFTVLGIGYFIWALTALPVLRLPISWIYRHRYGDMDKSQVDPQLIMFEAGIEKYIMLAALTAGVGTVLALLA